MLSTKIQFSAVQSFLIAYAEFDNLRCEFGK
jgi:hypothetical protein